MPLRKPTLLITTATFLLPMSDYVMTWERRWVVLGCYLWSILYQSSALLRQELKRLQKYKGIKMVKKYRDGQGKRRVVSCLIERRLEDCQTALKTKDISCSALYGQCFEVYPKFMTVN